MHSKNRYGNAARQKGATLVIAMLVLVLIMIIGITSITVSGTQFKLAGNLQFEDGALNNAETAVSTAENWLKTNFSNGGFVTYSSVNTPHLYPIGSTAAIVTSPLTATWSDSNSFCVGATDTACTGGNTAQRFAIQMISQNNVLNGANLVVGSTSTSCTKVNLYEITARGTSARGATKIVRSIYSVLSC